MSPPARGMPNVPARLAQLAQRKEQPVPAQLQHIDGHASEDNQIVRGQKPSPRPTDADDALGKLGGEPRQLGDDRCGHPVEVHQSAIVERARQIRAADLQFCGQLRITRE